MTKKDLLEGLRRELDIEELIAEKYKSAFYIMYGLYLEKFGKHKTEQGVNFVSSEGIKSSLEILDEASKMARIKLQLTSEWEFKRDWFELYDEFFTEMTDRDELIDYDELIENNKLMRD